MGRSVSLSSFSQSWVIPTHEKRKYTLMFNSLDRSQNGFLSAAEVQPLLMKSDLSRESLRQIWYAHTSNHDTLN